jgi:hypothetical protein
MVLCVFNEALKISFQFTARNPDRPCQAIQAFASNPATRKIFQKVGFRCLAEVDDFEDVTSGKQVFPGQTVTVHLLRIG